MANTLITPDVIARLAYANLYNNAVMAGLVHRDYSADFVGSVGDTVTIRKPATFTAQEFTSSITVQNVTESSTSVVLNKHLDVSFGVTAKELTLDLVDFNTQLVAPAVEALRQKIDQLLVGLAADVSNTVGEVGGTGEGDWTSPKSLIDAGRVLNQAKVPVTERYAVVGPVTQAKWLGNTLIHQADLSGSPEGLRNANIGRAFGFDTFMSQNISDPDGASAGSEKNLAFHRSAFALVSRALALPMGIGAGQGAVFGDNGIGIRVVKDYDSNAKQDVVSLDVLVGVKTLDASRACLIFDADGS